MSENNTKNILVCNTKGGVGKTCISTEVYFSLEQRGNEVVFLELDKQGGSIIELKRPTDETDFIVTDTPGYISNNFDNWCGDTDYILIPTLPSYEDLEPFMKTWKAIKRSGTDAEIGVVINRYDDHRLVDADYIETLKGITGDRIIGYLPVATAMTRAHAREQGIVVAEPNARISIEIEKIVDNILDQI